MEQQPGVHETPTGRVNPKKPQAGTIHIHDSQDEEQRPQDGTRKTRNKDRKTALHQYIDKETGQRDDKSSLPHGGGLLLKLREGVFENQRYAHKLHQ